MSGTSAFALGNFIPGFDFLRQLAPGGSASGAAPLPSLSLAPTLNVDELDKRIRELKAVQFWLEQNSAAVKATVQALEVQKMTLSALAGMNLSVAQVAQAFTAATPPAAAPKPGSRPAASPAEAAAQDKPAASGAPAKASAPGGDTGLVDPLQWWGALTQQFQQIAAQTLRETARAAPARKKPAAKKAAASKPPAKKAARKTAAPKAAATKKTGPSLSAWQLPPAFKPRG